MVDPRKSEDLPNKTEWNTPFIIFKWIEDLYKIRFNLDPCTSESNPLGTQFYFTPRTDGLAHTWRGKKVFVNPPYGPEIEWWVDKAIEEISRDPEDLDLEIVMLLPNSTDTEWFKRLESFADITFIRGRIKFVGAPSTPRNGSILAYLSKLRVSEGLSIVDRPEDY